MLSDLSVTHKALKASIDISGKNEIEIFLRFYLFTVELNLKIKRERERGREKERDLLVSTT